MIEFLQKNPLLAAFTGMGAVLTALNSFVGAFGFPPFWADVLVSAFLAYLGIHWWLTVLREMKQKKTPIWIGKPNKKPTFINTFRRAAGGSMIPEVYPAWVEVKR